MTPYSQRSVTEWTGAGALMQKWLAQRSAAESVLNLAGSALFFAFGLIALVVTSGAAALLTLLVLLEGNAALSFVGLKTSLLRPVLFGFLLVLFIVLTIIYAYKTRTDADTPAKFDLSIGFGLIWEFISAGPVLLVIGGQEFHRYLRLSRLDIPQVSALLLWIYDKGGRASFVEICIAFPGLNAVRVLPQLRDLPGIHWWPEDAEVSFAEDLLKTLANVLGREPKSSPFAHSHHYQRQRPRETVVEIDPEIRAWYVTLDLPLFATLGDVKKRYRKLAKIYHPDAQAGAGSKATNDDAMKRINEAYHNILRHTQSHAGPTQ